MWFTPEIGIQLSGIGIADRSNAAVFLVWKILLAAASNNLVGRKGVSNDIYLVQK